VQSKVRDIAEIGSVTHTCLCPYTFGSLTRHAFGHFRREGVIYEKGIVAKHAS